MKAIVNMFQTGKFQFVSYQSVLFHWPSFGLATVSLRAEVKADESNAPQLKRLHGPHNNKRCSCFNKF